MSWGILGCPGVIRLTGLFVLFFFPRGVLGEILNLIESVSEGFPSYFCVRPSFPFSIEGRAWVVIVLIPEHCLSIYFDIFWVWL